LTQRYPFAVIKEKLHERRGQVADLAIGRQRVPLAEELQVWIHENPGLALQAATPDDMREFRQAAVDYLAEEYAVRIDAAHIVPVPSGRAGMSAFIACIVEPRTGVVVTEPGYPAFARMAEHRHASVHAVELDPQHEFAPDLSTLSSGDVGSIRVMALNYPNNPTAALIAADTRAVIERAARRWGASVFNDAVYGPLIYEGQSQCLLSDGADDIDLVELHSLTKLYPLGPMAGSFLAGSASSITEIATYSEFAWAPMSALQIRATTWCLRDSDGRHGIRDFYSERIGQLREALTNAGFRPYPTPSGIYALCPVPAEMAGKAISSAAHAADVLLDEFDVAVMPWDVGERQYLRFCSMYLPEDLQRFVDAGPDLAVR
jgi:aspartate/methionine/tyrosine aminotransferase